MKLYNNQNVTIGFGKYANEPISTIKRDYLELLITNSKKTLQKCEVELQRRDNIEDADLNLSEQIITKGFRKLALERHPDHGGDAQKMRELQAAKDALLEILKEVMETS